MRNTNHLRIKLAAAVLAAAPAALAPRAHAQLASLPLPVTTNVTVTNPSIPVTGSVGITNQTLSVRDADNGARQPVVAAVSGVYGCSGANPSPNGVSYPVYTVPAQRTLVIESIDGIISNSQHTVMPYVSLQTSNPAGKHYLGLNTFPSGDAPIRVYTIDQATRYYAAPGSVVSVTVEALADINASTSCLQSFSISGHLVDTP
jgi:hypothetical protein